MAWIESHTTIRNHPKTKKLAKKLGVTRAEAVGYMHFLWWWALDYAESGELGDISPEDFAETIDWSGDPQLVVDAFVEAKLIDVSPRKGTMSIHDWHVFAGRLIDQRDKNRKRAQKARDAKKKEQGEGVCVPYANGTRTVRERHRRRYCDVRGYRT